MPKYICMVAGLRPQLNQHLSRFEHVAFHLVPQFVGFSCVHQVELFYTENIQVFKQQPVYNVGHHFFGLSAAAATAAPSVVNVFDPRVLAVPGAQMKTVPIIGHGQTTPGGVPKNQSCKTCNLHPIASSSSSESDDDDDDDDDDDSDVGDGHYSESDNDDYDDFSSFNYY